MKEFSMEPRVEKFADLLVNYSTSVRKGEWVGILGDVDALPALRAVYARVLEAGGHPSLMLMDETTDRIFARHASEEQITWLDPMQSLYYDKADVYIRVRGSANTRAMTSIPGVRTQQIAKARQVWLDTRLGRAAEGRMKWVGSIFPTQAFAQEANMSLEEFEDFVYGAMFCDQDDPKSAWAALGRRQQGKVDFLNGKKEIVCKGPNIDLSLSIEGRRFINCYGLNNMPDGEIFTGPVEDSVNGWVRFTYPALVSGRAVSGIELRFAEGRVVEAHAEQNDELLQAQLNTDTGARYLGEFAIGTNFGIQKFTGNILYDEKIGGTLHMAVGRSYAETGGRNQSAVHWDMICDMRTDSEIFVDGELFYKNGDFAV
jgi:aminopeptidase